MTFVNQLIPISQVGTVESPESHKSQQLTSNRKVIAGLRRRPAIYVEKPGKAFKPSTEEVDTGRSLQFAGQSPDQVSETLP